MDLILDNGQVPKLISDFRRRFLDIPSVEMYHPERIQQAEGIQHHRDTVLDIACKEKPSGFFAGDQSARQSVELRFGDFVDCYVATFRNEPHWLQSVDQLEFYLCQCPIAYGDDIDPSKSKEKKQETPVLPHIMKDFVVPQCLREERLLQVNLWMSIHESRTSIHYDAYQNILVVLHGQKRVQLYSPQESPALYPFPVYSKSANHSQVNFTQPDLSSHPRFADVSAQTIEVNAGDALFIPEGWWHQVDSHPFTIAVNFWFEGMREKLVRHCALLPYYTRVLVEEQLKLEKDTRIQRLITEQHQVQQQSCARWSNALASASRAAQEFVRCETQQAKESLMFALSLHTNLFRDIQMELAMDHRVEWDTFLKKTSNEMAVLLGRQWDAMMTEQTISPQEQKDGVHASASTVEVDKAGVAATTKFFEKLFEHLDEREAEALKSELLAKDMALTRQLCQQVMNGWLGLGLT